jgi:hypothetical protein
MAKKTLAEQVKDLEATRQAKAARMDEIMETPLAEGRSTDTAEGEEFDTLQGELKQIDADIARLRTLEAMNLAAATAVVAEQSATVQRSGISVHVKSADAAEAFAGQNFTRKVIAKAVGLFQQRSPISVAVERWGKSNPSLIQIIKANEVAGGGTESGEWGAELVAMDGRYTGDFIEYLYGLTAYDRLGLRVVPANVTIKGQDGPGTAYWIGQSKAIKATAVDFSTVNLTPLKVAALSVLSNELIADSSPAAEMLVRDALAQAAAKRIDQTFFSTTAAVSNVSPAGMAVGVSAISSSGTDAAALRNDIKALFAPFQTAMNSGGLTLVMNPAMATGISFMVNALGQAEFPGTNINGGSLLGFSIVVGDNVPATWLVMLKASDIYRIGDDGLQTAVSRDAMIEQSTAPTGATDTPTAASQAITSMFQEDSTAIRVIRRINFAKRRAHAFQYISDADYGAVSS